MQRDVVVLGPAPERMQQEDWVLIASLNQLPATILEQKKREMKLRKTSPKSKKIQRQSLKYIPYPFQSLTALLHHWITHTYGLLSTPSYVPQNGYERQSMKCFLLSWLKVLLVKENMCWSSSYAFPSCKVALDWPSKALSGTRTDEGSLLHSLSLFIPGLFYHSYCVKSFCIATLETVREGNVHETLASISLYPVPNYTVHDLIQSKSVLRTPSLVLVAPVIQLRLERCE